MYTQEMAKQANCQIHVNINCKTNKGTSKICVLCKCKETLIKPTSSTSTLSSKTCDMCCIYTVMYCVVSVTSLLCLIEQCMSSVRSYRHVYKCNYFVLLMTTTTQHDLSHMQYHMIQTKVFNWLNMVRQKGTVYTNHHVQ